MGSEVASTEGGATRASLQISEAMKSEVEGQ